MHFLCFQMMVRGKWDQMDTPPQAAVQERPPQAGGRKAALRRPEPDGTG
jgi:hypothetical protein